MDAKEQPKLTFPTLAAPYDQALRAAVTYVLDRYTLLGLIAGGSIIRGNPGPSSDFDIYVILSGNQRQRVQKRFHGVPAEIFVNNPAAVRRYFVDERDEGRPTTAHLLATGAVILNQDPVVDELCNEARQWLTKRPDLSPNALLMKRYFIADVYDNAKDLRQSDPAMAAMILHDVVRSMVEYAYLAANHNLPRLKETISALGTLDKGLQELVEDYYSVSDNDQRFALAAPIAAYTLGVDGFFEWETELHVFP